MADDDKGTPSEPTPEAAGAATVDGVESAKAKGSKDADAVTVSADAPAPASGAPAPAPDVPPVVLVADVADAPEAEASPGPKIDLGDAGAAIQSAFQDLLKSKGIKVGEGGKIDATTLKAENLTALQDGVRDVATQLFGAFAKGLKGAAENVTPAAAPSAQTATYDGPADAEKTTAPPAGPVAVGDNVVPLDQARRARAKSAPGAFETSLQGNLKDALGRFFAGAAEDGKVQVDLDFLKERGASFMGNLLGAVSDALSPLVANPSVDIPIPTGDADVPSATEGDAADAAEADGSAEAPVTTVNFDMQGIVRSLFRPVVESLDRAAKSATAPKVDASAAPEDDGSPADDSDKPQK